MDSERDPTDVLDERDDYDAAEVDAEAPEADAAEQSRAIDAENEQRPQIGLEVNEADAAEQARVVDFDEDYRA